MNLSNLTRRLNVVLGSVVFFTTALAVSVNEFVAQVAPELPGGWEDTALRIGAAVVSVLGSVALAVRRVTEVPADARGLTLPPGVDMTVATSRRQNAGGTVTLQTGDEL
jgi:hypothetical protein